MKTRNAVPAGLTAKILFTTVLFTLAHAPVARAATLTVTNTADSGAGTLRSLVAGASPGDTITFAPSLSSQTIRLTNGQIALGKNLTIDGSSLTSPIQLNGNHASRIFAITNGATVTLASLVLTNGYDATSSAGGAVLNNAGCTLTVNNCLFTSNTVTTGIGGGAVHSEGFLTLNNSAFVGNVAIYGGALGQSGTTWANNCTFSANTGTTWGGAITLGGGTIVLNNCTIAHNSAGTAGGIYFYNPNGTLAMTNTIVSANTAGTSNNVYNASGSSPGLNNLVDVTNINLAPLGNYGGPTPTMPPLPGSPAIDAGDDAVTNFLATDQRGFARLIGAHVDIGAVEFQYGLSVLSAADSGENTLRTDAQYDPPGSTLTFAPSLSGQTILLTHGQIVLDKDLTIDGWALASPIQLNGNQASRIFAITNGATVTLASLVFTNGFDSSSSGGGAVLNNSGCTLTVSNCLFTGNNSGTNASGGGGIGGAVASPGSLTLNNSSFVGNTAVAGGAIASQGTMWANNCTFSSNSVTEAGGAIILGGGTTTVILNNSTIANNNSAIEGGGIYYVGYGTVELNNATVAYNSCAGTNSRGGGGIYCWNAGTVELNNATVVYNSCAGTNSLGGGIYDADQLTMTNTIVEGNTARFYNDICSSSYLASCCRTGGGVNLAPLGNYGGPTETMPPMPGPAYTDVGNDAVTNFLTTDQRGVPRLVGAHVDIGAVELQANMFVVSTNTDNVNGYDIGGVCLRTAIAYDRGTITFAPSLSGQTILLTNGQIEVHYKTITIDGSTLASPIQLNGNHASRIFVITGAIVTLASLVLTNGYDTSTLGGGAVLNYGSGKLTVSNCLFTGNSVTNNGGAVYNKGSLTLDSCAFTGNTAANGGAVGSSGTTWANNCTFSGNSGTNYGGAIYSLSGNAVLNNDTLANNSAGTGGGFYNASGTVTMTNTIVSANIAGSSPNDNGSYSGLSNLVDVAGINLAPLGNYSGPTPTMPPLPGSPAIDAGDDAVTSFLTTDQRGLLRLVGAHVDIGAVEGVYVANYAGPGPLNDAIWLGNGSFQFGFTNYPDLNISFSVWATTNLALPFAQWSNLGAPVETPPGSGLYQFTDPGATNSLQRFYRIVSP